MNIKVSEVVNQFLDEYNFGASEFRKAYNIAIRGWRQLNWDIVGQAKVVCLDLGCDKTCKLPDDFISEISVGTYNEHGQIASLTRLKHQPGPRTVSDVRNVVGDIRVLDLFDNFYNPSLGVGSYRSDGDYYIDKASHTIYARPDCQHTSVVLEYLSYLNVDGEYEINELASEALLAWIDWKFSKGYKQMSPVVLREKERLFYAEKSKAKLRIKKLTVSDLNKAARESVKMGIKS